MGVFHFPEGLMLSISPERGAARGPEAPHLSENSLVITGFWTSFAVFWLRLL